MKIIQTNSYTLNSDLYAGGTTAMNTMIIFDFQIKVWTIHNDIWPGKVWRKGHALIKSKHDIDTLLLQTMGGWNCKTSCGTTSHLYIKLSSKLDWSI